MTAVALTIAGSDSGGGAGIQADLKAFASCGVHGTSALTAITAQNTVAVRAVHPLPAEIVLAQIRAVAEDFRLGAVKVGMLGTRQVVLAVATALSELPEGVPVVVDPVMVAESGARLLDADAAQALIEEILPLARVITPNVLEARVLLGGPPEAGADDEQAEQLARGLLALGPRAVLLTGGHRATATDMLIDSQGDGAVLQIEGPRHPDGAAHGSGCTHSSVLAAHLALGEDLAGAARAARAAAGAAVGRGLRDVGAGPGPVDVIDLPARRRD